MIYTITLNPAVDRTIILNNFKIDQVNRAQEIREDAGGKGINVSKMIRNLGGESVALGIVGGRQGSFIRQQLESMGIYHDFVEGEGNTRTNIKVVDPVNQTFTDINESGIAVSAEILSKMENTLFDRIEEDDILVLAGSVPQGCGELLYKNWIQKGKEKKAKVFLDADGVLLEEGILAGPYLIKPNIHELEKLYNTEMKSVDDIIFFGKKILDFGVQIVVISRGKDGCLLITKEKTILVEGFSVEVKSTVGAGDAMVGALAFALEQGNALEDAILLGVAASTASIQEDGTKMGALEDILQLKEQAVFKILGGR